MLFAEGSSTGSEAVVGVSACNVETSATDGAVSGDSVALSSTSFVEPQHHHIDDGFFCSTSCKVGGTDFGGFELGTKPNDVILCDNNKKISTRKYNFNLKMELVLGIVFSYCDVRTQRKLHAHLHIEVLYPLTALYARANFTLVQATFDMWRKLSEKKQPQQRVNSWRRLARRADAIIIF